jgi:hypothetical protein
MITLLVQHLPEVLVKVICDVLQQLRDRYKIAVQVHKLETILENILYYGRKF